MIWILHGREGDKTQVSMNTWVKYIDIVLVEIQRVGQGKMVFRDKA